LGGDRFIFRIRLAQADTGLVIGLRLALKLALQQQSLLLSSFFLFAVFWGVDEVRIFGHLKGAIARENALLLLLLRLSKSVANLNSI